MKELTVPYINFIIANFEIIINKSIKCGFNNRAIRYLKALSYIRYKFFLDIRDVYIEDKITILSQQIVKASFKKNNYEKSIVIVDEINADYIGLMVQYLSALITGSYHILYIYEHIEHPSAARSHLMQLLNGYCKAEVKKIPSKLHGFSKSQWIYNEICKFGAKKILMNFGEWAIESCVACTALPEECNKYRINAADHCFWAGTSCADYTFEFRHYGANLTFKERGLRRDQIVYNPFYPVMKDVAFGGFPDEAKDKFIFLSGGAIYKIVDDDNTFFKHCKLILDRCPNSVILFAGADMKNTVISSGIAEFGLQGRFLPLGYRKDILEVFKRCDVYINTYPLGGGLMCQYAAQCSKPILNYKDRESEECIAQKKDCSFTSFTEDLFVDEAERLYSDNEYRKKRGEEMNHAVISKEEFDIALLSFLNTGKSIYEVRWNDDFVPKNYRIEDAIAYNNRKLASFYVKLFKLLGFDSILTMPRNVLSLGIYGIKRQLKKMKNNN